jgi:hypothetical protein
VAELARKLRAAGWPIKKIAEHIGKPYTTTYELVRGVKRAKRNKQPKITGAARCDEWTDGEDWLLRNDPEYARYRRERSAPATDALARVYSGNEAHRTLAELRKLPITDHESGMPATGASARASEYDSDGNYRRAPTADSDDGDDD